MEQSKYSAFEGIGEGNFAKIVSSFEIGAFFDFAAGAPGFFLLFFKLVPFDSLPPLLSPIIGLVVFGSVQNNFIAGHISRERRLTITFI
jgi:hypothetical protein